MKGRLYKLIYQFSRHYLFGWTLYRWMLLALLLAPLILVLVSARQSAADIVILAAVTIISAACLFFTWRLRQGGYLDFEPHPPGEPTPANPLPPSEKIPLHASGNFSVGNRTRYFVEEAALYQTFKTRERAIMVAIERSRYLLLAQSSEAEVGWWYAFFTPHIIQAVQPGRVCFGAHMRPALRITYYSQETDTPETLYLSFNSPDERRQVLADLEADCS